MLKQKQMLRFAQHDKREGRFVYVFVRHYARSSFGGKQGCWSGCSRSRTEPVEGTARTELRGWGWDGTSPKVPSQKVTLALLDWWEAEDTLELFERYGWLGGRRGDGLRVSHIGASDGRQPSLFLSPLCGGPSQFFNPAA